MEYDPKYIYYILTTECNQRCSKCSHWLLPKQYLFEVEYFIEFVKYCVDVKEVSILGGEPLVYREKVLHIIDSLSNDKLKVVFVTNGINLTIDFIDRIFNKNIHIIVSIDTLDRNFWKIVRGVDSYDIVFNNLRYLFNKVSKQNITIQALLAKETINHIKNVELFARENKVGFEKQLYFTNLTNGNWKEIIQVNNKTIISNQKCFANKQNITIHPNGDVFICFKQNEINYCEKPLGNLKKNRPNEILNSDYTRFVVNELFKCNLPCKSLKCNVNRDNV